MSSLIKSRFSKFYLMLSPFLTPKSRRWMTRSQLKPEPVPRLFRMLCGLRLLQALLLMLVVGIVLLRAQAATVNSLP